MTVAEGLKDYRKKARSSKLQWGRNLTVAEGARWRFFYYEV